MAKPNETGYAVGVQAKQFCVIAAKAETIYMLEPEPVHEIWVSVTPTKFVGKVS